MSTAPVSIEVAEKKAKRFYIALVVFLFVIQITIMATVMHLAIGDPSAAVVPDYHNAALNWDETRRQREAATRLGWHVDFSASDVADGLGRRAIELSILDSQGQAIDGLVISGTLYHHALANDVINVDLRSVGDGKYLALAPAERKGIWQLELAIGGADQPMAKSLTFEVEG